MKFPDTTAREFPIENGKEYLVTANDGDCTIERQDSDSTWRAVENSPLLDGQERLLITESHNSKVRVTPSVGDTFFTLSATK